MNLNYTDIHFLDTNIALSMVLPQNSNFKNTNDYSLILK